MTPLAASTAEAVDLSAGAAILGLLLLLCCCCLDACRLRPRKKNERRDYMHQVFISSYLPIVFLLLPFRFLVICRRYFVCTYSYMGRDSAYEVFLLFYSILHMNVWPLLCFVKLDGWQHEYNYTINIRLHMTRGSPNNVCIVANAWYNCSCLLYTSPSPRDKRQSRMPSSA